MAWIDGMIELWNSFRSGDILMSIIGVYTISMGDWFYALILFFGLLMVYFKSDDFGTTIITGIIVTAAAYGAAELNIIPVQTQFLITIFIALGITVILWRVFKSD